MTVAYKRVVNRTKGTVLAEQAEVADTPLKRLKGLLGRSSLKAGTGLIIIPCSSIHTFFMRFSIDAIFIGKNNRIVAMANSLPPWRLFGSLFKGETVLELPKGVINRTNTTIGDILEITSK